MKQWRAVYQYRKDLIRGAGACFAIAPDEASARANIAKAMPGVEIIELKEEPEDVLAQYERPRLALVPPKCELCDALLVIGPEIQRRLCADCERDLPSEGKLAVVR